MVWPYGLKWIRQKRQSQCAFNADAYGRSGAQQPRRLVSKYQTGVSIITYAEADNTIQPGRFLDQFSSRKT
jgi:hypothetical protein